MRSAVLRSGMMGGFAWHGAPIGNAACAVQRYSSEGGYVRPTGLGRLGRRGAMLRAYGNMPRPESWASLRVHVA